MDLTRSGDSKIAGYFESFQSLLKNTETFLTPEAINLYFDEEPTALADFGDHITEQVYNDFMVDHYNSLLPHRARRLTQAYMQKRLEVTDDDLSVIFESDNYQCTLIKTYDGAKKASMNTNWCIGDYKTPNWWAVYGNQLELIAIEGKNVDVRQYNRIIMGQCKIPNISDYIRIWWDAYGNEITSGDVKDLSGDPVCESPRTKYVDPILVEPGLYSLLNDR